MKLASTIHNIEIRYPLFSDYDLLRSSPVSRPKNVPIKLIFCRSRRHFSERCACCGRRYYSKPVLLSSVSFRSSVSCGERRSSLAHWEPSNLCCSATEASKSQSPSGINDDESSSSDAPSGISGEKTLRTANFDSSLRTVALCVLSAVAFGVGLGFKDGVGKATEYFAGYLLEQSLSVDNLFVFVLVFNYFKVPANYQNRVLSYGIAGAVIIRLSLILLGIATLQRFEAVNVLLALILLYSSFKLFNAEDEDTDLSDNFIVRTCQKFIPVTSNYEGDRFITTQDGVLKATPLLLTLVVIELSDIAFAVDSIPAVFGVTRDPFIAFTSNLFAILGLRSYYTLISESMAELEYLQPAIAAILGFIGTKMILDFLGFHVPTEVSLGLVATSLSCGVFLSLVNKEGTK